MLPRPLVRTLRTRLKRRRGVPGGEGGRKRGVGEKGALGREGEGGGAFVQTHKDVGKASARRHVYCLKIQKKIGCQLMFQKDRQKSATPVATRTW